MDMACLGLLKVSQRRWPFVYVSGDPADPRKVGETICSDCLAHLPSRLWDVLDHITDYYP